MKYIYQTNTGKTEIEVDEQFHDLLVTMDRNEFNSDRKHSRRYPISLENCEYEGEWFDDGTDLLATLIQEESCEKLRTALKKLTPEQQHLIQQIYFDDVSAIDIAKAEGVDKSAISHRLSRAIKSLKKYLD